MHTGNNIIIDAPREDIFATVSDLARWPDRLSHYRYVRFTGRDGDRDIVEMSAFRGRMTLSWTALYEPDKEAMELRFEHLRSWTKGMTALWTLTPTRDATRVEIQHSMKFRVRAIAWIAERIIGEFMSDISAKTLAEFKALIEKANGTGGPDA